MRPQDRSLPWFLPPLFLAGMVGCAGIHVSFHQTDPSFQPVPVPPSGDLPIVYMNEKDVPPVAIRSVGIISVDDVVGMSLSEIGKKAAAKGGELGCWAVVEHSAFLMLQRQGLSWLSAPSGSVILVHGEGGGGASGSGGHTGWSEPRTRKFDCVVRDDVNA